ncbi:PREDICTED: DNA (cytosine-5)-methyltransferase PliMCI-like [Ceratosolen solmsi marchali]|uniref:DNA (cytosine-5-)-methyltransferase n=1 Tax=Ceratosolen solmsi marchali TaxID=326594 RepID=A0AAJ6YWR1_9HYME|nr:PREDICTED: DNA (cytosine-5)-methyltransferase PliMCI-like [Ceratosolen solmsi marchali]
MVSVLLTYYSKCEICKQNLEDKYLNIYNGHPNNAVDEHIALIDEKLSFCTGHKNINQTGLRAAYKITLFNVYCKNGHLCPFDSGLVNKDMGIYISGYLKPMYCNNQSRISDAVSTKDIGPIVHWFIADFISCQEVTVVLSTSLGEYYLMQPSTDYKPFMISVGEKIFLCKIVIESLLNDPCTKYEELLNKFKAIPMPQSFSGFIEDFLIYNAQFICEQIVLFDEAATSEESLLINAPCIKFLIDLAGITIQKDFKKTKIYPHSQNDNWLSKLRCKYNKFSSIKLTTTQQVQDILESIIPIQQNNISNKRLLKCKRSVKTCKMCLKIDCDECSVCNFDNPGTSNQVYINYQCQKMKIVSASLDSNYKYSTNSKSIGRKSEPNKKIHRKLKKNKSIIMTWVGEPILSSKGDFYDAVIINSEMIKRNDYIFIDPIDPSVPMQVIKVRYLWESKLGNKMLHGTWLWRGTETILGEMSLPRELFLVDECQDVPLKFVQSKANVVILQFSSKNIDNESIAGIIKKNNKSLFCQKRYDHVSARFENILPDLEAPQEKEHCFCSTCTRNSLTNQYKTPQLFEKLEEMSDSVKIKFGMVKYLGEEFRIGTAVYLKPKTLGFKYLINNKKYLQNFKKKIIDEKQYPEFYRKFNDKDKNSKFDIPEPFDIGYITSIYSTSKSKLLASINLYITVKKLYRPENTHASESLKRNSDINILYWSEEECDVQFRCVIGKCYLTYLKNLYHSIEEWSAMGPNRFYFAESYDSKKKQFLEPPLQARKIGKNIKTDRYMKSRNNKIDHSKVVIYPQITKKLKILDIFSGCGGLSEGLKLSGVAESQWAVENDEAAANAYRLNNLNALIFTTDCNTFLKKVINGETTLDGQKLPQKGEVDLLCGGPPYQEFNSMNSFNSTAYSLFTNSFIITCISFCNYYKPRFFIMENIRNFVSFKKTTILKLTLSCLVQMGYQCTFGILQVGNYGIPQTQKRMILLAAAAGEILPKFPSPLHVFNKSTSQLYVDIDDKKYYSLKELHNSAPYRAITVYDALSDLPKIVSGNDEVVMQYSSKPITHFQRKMRRNTGNELVTLNDHICKYLGPLVEARMRYVPTKVGSDWRDLPNISVRLSDGSYIDKLIYKYNNNKSEFISSTGILRGVCTCCENKPCNVEDKQVNTLIPWCLSHTANENNNWAGLYGRIEWDRFFSASITNPEPMGKQGRILHPEQPRVVSVRECARSQGFSDNFRFYGSIQDKHKQIGNAVPPPLGAAIGNEIRKSLSFKEMNILY